MNSQRYILLLTAVILYTVSANAQQIEQFSLFRENAVALNPAMVGTKGFLSGTGTFRKQFATITDAPYTAYLMMDGQVTDKNFGVGGSFIHDQTGPTGKTGITIAASYQIRLGKSRNRYATIHYNTAGTHMLTIGISVSMMQYRLNGSMLHPEMGGDPELYTSHAYKLLPDVAFGIYYQWKKHLYAGVSVPQVLGLPENYVARDGVSSIKTVQHLNFLLGGKIDVVKRKFSLDPAGTFRWVKGAPPQGDIGLRLTFLEGLWVGGGYRSSQYIVMDAGVEIKGMIRLSYAYDYDLSAYRPDIGPTHEFTLGFRYNHHSVKDTRFFAGMGRE